MNRSTPGLPVPPSPSPTPRVYPNSCPLSQWCHLTISSSVIPFSSCLQSFPASGSFQMSQFFTWGGQSTGVSASVSVLPVNTQHWSPLGWIGWISLKFSRSQGTLKSLLQHHSSKASILQYSVFFIVQLSHDPTARDFLCPHLPCSFLNNIQLNIFHLHRELKFTSHFYWNYDILGYKVYTCTLSYSVSLI